MTKYAPDRPGRKNRIATHASNINLILLALVLALMIVLSVVVISGIGNDYSKSLVRAYSIEASQAFYSYISQDLTLLQKASRSVGIANWFADETDGAKKAFAFEEMMVYAEVLQGANFFFGIQDSLHEYSIMGKSTLEEFVPNDSMDSSNTDDYWYFECTGSENDYTLNNDVDKFTNTWCLWINHKVSLDGNLVGVISSGMRIPEFYQKIFDKYAANNIKGYIINKQGIIQTDNTVNPGYYMGKQSNIIGEDSDLMFAAAMEQHLRQIDGLFDDLPEPVVVKLSSGKYEYAAISPIINTDWSVAIFYHNDTFSGIRNLIPLVLVMFAAFFLYVAGGNTLMNRVVFVPLGQLTLDVSENKLTGKAFYGRDRDDEIGELARTIHNSLNEQQRQRQLLHSVNTVAEVLLSTNSDINFEASLHKAMGLIGNCLDVDRIQIWRNVMVDGELCFILDYQWLSDFGQHTWSAPMLYIHPYSKTPEWEKRFSQNEKIINSFSRLSMEDQDILRPYQIKSIILFPMFVQNHFWGFISFDDCRCERTFTEDELDILSSGCLMMINALNRNTQTIQLQQAHERTQILLDAMPLSCQLWTKDAKLFDCNEEAVKLFRARDKQDFVNRFWEFSPEYQNDGGVSYDKAMFYLEKAFSEGRVVFEWMHQIPNVAKIPAEVTAVRLKFGDEDIIAVYARDLREYTQMMQEIEKRDSLLNIVNDSATILLQSETSRFERDLHHCMGMIAESIDIQGVSIWKNHFEDNELFCSQVYQWISGDELPVNKMYANISYREKIPDWEGILSKGDCINNLVCDRPAVEQALFAPQGLKTIFVMPVFVQDEFWGFVEYDDCQTARIFSENEQLILRSGGMVIANAFLRNEMTRSIYDTATKLEAVVANYSGIIWSVDNNYVITIYDGLLLKQLNKKSPLIEGKKLESYMSWEKHSTIISNIRKTFSDGPQDWITQVDDIILHARSTPIFDEFGNIASIVGSFDDITELSRLQTDLEAALKEARKANAAKTTFLARMSHEMRTPLNAIIGLSELTLGSGGMSGECSSNLEKICNAGITLLSTVNHILDISKIEAGKFELIPVEYEISSLLNDTITQSMIYKDEKPVKFILDIDENLPTRLFGDDLRVKQIMNNLLSNAFKYTQEGTVELNVYCSREDASESSGDDMVWMYICVKDTGIGIREIDIPNLFVDYEKLDLEANRRIEGAGLGLPITKKIVEMMEGLITVESEYGKGSAFTAKFRQKSVTSAVIGAEVAENLKNLRYSDQKRHKSSRMMRINLSYAHVLVVDDVETNLDVTKGMLKPYGMQVDCMGSGKEAINAIRSEEIHYNAVFMDHMMPEMDGIEATRIIREEIGTEYAKTVPIIALTANAIMGNEEMFLSHGFQAFISKPIEIERLDAVIREWIRNKDLERDFEEIDVNGEMLPDVRSGSERRTIMDRRSGIDRRTLGNKINGINYEKGLKRFNEDEDSFLKVLRSYSFNIRPLINSVKNVTRNNLAKYAVTVHGIKGASNGICAEQLGAKAEALEQAAKNGNIDFVTANNTAFIEDTEKLMDDLEEMFRVIASENPKPKKDRIDPEALKKLVLACREYNMDGVDAAMEEIEAFEYDSDRELAFWLRENVNDANFARIKDKLGITDYD